MARGSGRPEHHVDGARSGDMRYTEPLLNNLPIVEPTLYWLANR